MHDVKVQVKNSFINNANTVHDVNSNGSFARSLNYSFSDLILFKSSKWRKFYYNTSKNNHYLSSINNSISQHSFPVSNYHEWHASRLNGDPCKNWLPINQLKPQFDSNILVYNHTTREVHDVPVDMIEPREIYRVQYCYNDDLEDNPTHRLPFPTTRRPWQRPLSNAPQSVVDEWFASSQIEIAPCDSDILSNTKRLMYTYRDLNAMEIRDIPATDLFVHRARLKPGTKPHREKRILQQTDRQKFWLQKTIEEGLESGMYERVPIKNGKFSDWSAGARVVEKPGNTADMRVTFNYHYVFEEMPGTYMELMSIGQFQFTKVIDTFMLFLFRV